MRMLADFMHNNAAASVVDVGCGDWQFSRVMDWSGIRYQGFYLVDTVIDISKDRFARDNTTFATMRGISDLTNADLLVCKDVLRYFPNGVLRLQMLSTVGIALGSLQPSRILPVVEQSGSKRRPP